ncbi:glycosyltransferase family 4 protein [Halorubrum ezzemoulense]|uniref:glycosyltransferase family 4 protein n=1 Tax=Halorubrum ezzemoulense TaxID=337243 RepID=UPI0012BACDDD|nr:glycosyltransferase family 4 protein [Halorubrum ezzemoulense]
MTVSEPYTIVFVSSHLGHVRGGAEINDLNLGRELSELGHDVQYITQRSLIQSEIDIDADCHSVKIPYLYGWSYSLFEPAGKILRHLNEEWFRHRVASQLKDKLADADFVLATGRPLLIKLKSITDAPVFYSVRGKTNQRYFQYLEQADGLIFWGGCESEYSNDRILSRPSLSINPAVDEANFKPMDIEAGVLDKWRADEELLVAFVGRLEPVKRVNRLIDAVVAADSEIRLLVVGDGSRRSTLEEHADQVAPGEVSFLGHCDQEVVAKIFNFVDVFAMASEHENHPIALKEALACGTYCIAPDVGRVSSMIQSDTGTVVADNDVVALSSALDDAVERGVSATDRFERAQPQNAWRENAEAVIAFYEGWLGGDAGEDLS